jgi:hypothetical protein
MVDQPIWQIESSSDFVTIRFCGNLDTVSGLASAMALAELLRAAGRVVIWDVREMTGYDTGARTAWQKHIQPLRHQIREIRVLGATPITRFGTAALAMALGVPATFDRAP